MIKEDTVFILGAGASAPYGYPTAKGLRKDICHDFPEKVRTHIPASQTFLSHEKIKSLFQDADELADTFDLSSTPSIDLFSGSESQTR